MCFKKALELLPEPKDDWEAATWLYVAIGDAFFFLEKYEEALDNLKHARMCPDGMANSFILMRLGEVYYELKEIVLFPLVISILICSLLALISEVLSIGFSIIVAGYGICNLTNKKARQISNEKEKNKL